MIDYKKKLLAEADAARSRLERELVYAEKQLMASTDRRDRARDAVDRIVAARAKLEGVDETEISRIAELIEAAQGWCEE